MKYFSMFSGIGGFELGIKKATNNIWECIGYSEINKYAIQIYEKHFPEHKNYEDATTINPEELPDFDMLCGGFPCQAFSIAGKRMGFKDTRGTLFFEIARIVKVKRPQILFLENVKGLLSHDNGRTIACILAALDELGYNAEWQVLNSKHFGVPQNRERVFIIGHLRGGNSRQVFPIKKTNQIYVEKNRKWMVSNTLCKNYSYSSTGATIIKQHGKYRILTPIECERLQSFPDGWTEGISDTQRYKCLGNAVTVNVIEVIISQMRYINEHPKLP